MSICTIAMAALLVLTSVSPVTAVELIIMLDNSGSVGHNLNGEPSDGSTLVGTRAAVMRNEVATLQSENITLDTQVAVWSAGVDMMVPLHAFLTVLLPLPEGSTSLGQSLQQLYNTESNGPCEQGIVVVTESVPDDIWVLRDALPRVLEKNRILVLVMAGLPESGEVYRTFLTLSMSDRYQVELWYSGSVAASVSILWRSLAGCLPMM